MAAVSSADRVSSRREYGSTPRRRRRTSSTAASCSTCFASCSTTDQRRTGCGCYIRWSTHPTEKASVTAPLVDPGAPLGPERLSRYSRQLLLPGFGEEAQRRLANARVLVVGAG